MRKEEVYNMFMEFLDQAVWSQGGIPGEIFSYQKYQRSYAMLGRLL